MPSELEGVVLHEGPPDYDYGAGALFCAVRGLAYNQERALRPVHEGGGGGGGGGRSALCGCSGRCGTALGVHH
jgi:hypothetical protein